MNQDAPPEQSNLRDLGLIMFGYAICGDAQRASVAAMIQPDELPKDIRDLLTSLMSQPQNREYILKWLEARSVIVDKGMKPIEAVAQAIRSHTRRQVRRQMVSMIVGSDKICKTDQEFVSLVSEELAKYSKLLEE